MHYHQYDKIAKDELKRIAKKNKRSLNSVIKGFTVGQDEEITRDFWIGIRAKYPDKFNRVEYCPSCKKFDVYYEKDLDA